MIFEIAPDAALPAELGEGRRFATGDARGSDGCRGFESCCIPWFRPPSRMPEPGLAVDRLSCSCRPPLRRSLTALAGKGWRLCVVAGGLRRL